jgi:hypothetical protein
VKYQQSNGVGESPLLFLYPKPIKNVSLKLVVLTRRIKRSKHTVFFASKPLVFEIIQASGPCALALAAIVLNSITEKANCYA